MTRKGVLGLRRYTEPEMCPTVGGNTVDDDGNDEVLKDDVVHRRQWPMGHLMTKEAVQRPQRYIGARTCPTTGGNSVDDIRDDEGKSRKAWEADGRRVRRDSAAARVEELMACAGSSRAACPAGTTVPYFYQV